MKKQKAIWVSLCILLIFSILGACALNEQVNATNESSTQMTSEAAQLTSDSTSPSQAIELETTNIQSAKDTTAMSSVTNSTTMRIAFSETTSSQRGPYPDEMTPEMEKNAETILSVLTIPDGFVGYADHIAKILYRLNVGELTEVSLVPSVPSNLPGYGLQIRDISGDFYILGLDDHGDLRKVSKVNAEERKIEIIFEVHN